MGFNPFNPLGIDPLGGAIGGLFGFGGHGRGQAVAPKPSTHFKNVAESSHQSAYNAPDALSRMSTPAGYGNQPGGQMRPTGMNLGNPGISPFQNAAATMGMANPTYGFPSAQYQGGRQPGQPKGPMMRPMMGALPMGSMMMNPRF